MEKFEKSIRWLSQWFDKIAQIGLVLMMLVVVVNVLSRALWQSLPGTFEIAGYLGVIVVGFGLAYCGVRDGFVAITVVTERFSRRTQAIISIIVGILNVCLFLVGAWYLMKWATDMVHAGEVSPSLRFSFYPLVYICGLCCLLLSLVYLVKVLKVFVEVLKK
jgi:TRAP-type C4-dicarboxylate transport system permease small subunit